MTCTYIYIYTFIHIYIYILYTKAQVGHQAVEGAYKYVSAHTYTYVHTYVHTSTHTHTHIHTYMHTQQADTHSNAYTYVYTCIYIPAQILTYIYHHIAVYTYVKGILLMAVLTDGFAVPSLFFNVGYGDMGCGLRQRNEISSVNGNVPCTAAAVFVSSGGLESLPQVLGHTCHTGNLSKPGSLLHAVFEDAGDSTDEYSKLYERSIAEATRQLGNNTRGSPDRDLDQTVLETPLRGAPKIQDLLQQFWPVVGSLSMQGQEKMW